MNGWKYVVHGVQYTVEGVATAEFTMNNEANAAETVKILRVFAFILFLLVPFIPPVDPEAKLSQYYTKKESCHSVTNANTA
jgi:uncharacterized membrane protein YadS